MIENSKKVINPTNNQQNSCWNFLKNFDIFGITFHFRMEADEKFQSSTGGFWFLGFIILSFLLMFNTIRSYFKNPEFNSFYSEVSLNITNPNDHIKLYEDKFDYGIFFSLNKDIFRNDTFLIKTYYMESNKETKFRIKKTELNEIDCNHTRFISHTKNYNKRAKSYINKTTCFDLSNYTIKGNYFDENFSYFLTELQLKNNLNVTNIEALIDIYPPEFQIIYPNVVLNSNDYSTFHSSPHTLYEGFQMGIRKIIDFYVVKYEFEQDLGVIFTEKQTFSYTKYEKSIYRTKKLAFNSEGYVIYASVYVRGLGFIKKNRKHITKLITVCQLQMNNLLNYLVLFKIAATTINYKIAKKHFTKNLYVFDKNLIKELKKHVKIDHSKKKLNLEKENNLDKLQYSEKKDYSVDENKNDILDKSVELKNKFSFEKNPTSKENEKNNSIFFNNMFKDKEEIENNKTTQINFDKKETLRNNNNNNSSLDITSKRIFLNIEVDKNKNNQKEIKNNFNNDNSIIIIENNQEKNNFNNKNSKENLDILFDVEQKFKVYEKILDITYFKKKMEEIELLKYLLFDKKSIYFFNFLAGKINPFDRVINPYNFEDFDHRESLIKNYYIKSRQTKNNFVERKIIKLFEKFLNNN